MTYTHVFSVLHSSTETIRHAFVALFRASSRVEDLRKIGGRH
jgi:hypothetical protein